MDIRDLINNEDGRPSYPKDTMLVANNGSGTDSGVSDEQIQEILSRLTTLEVKKDKYNSFVTEYKLMGTVDSDGKEAPASSQYVNYGVALGSTFTDKTGEHPDAIVKLTYYSPKFSFDGVTITDTQYFDSKLGVQVYIKNNQNNVLSGTDLTGTYFQVDGVRYYPDINGYTHIKLADKVGNTEKWLIFNTDNSTLASGSYTFVIETFASPDGIYYSKGDTNNKNVPITIISSVYGLNPIIDDNSVIFSANNDKNLAFTINYTSLLDNPNIRIAMYRRKYDNIYDTNYELVDLQDYVDQQLFGTNNTNEYLLVNDPLATNDFVLLMEDELLTGTYRLAFRLYDNDTMIGEIIRYIIIK